jgi:hypothetical protein
MMAVWAVLCGLLGLVVLTLRDAVKAICRKELGTRLSQLPQALLWLAVRQLPKEWRDDLSGEWRSELIAIGRETSGTPLTGLVKKIFFVAVLTTRARAIGRAYAGRPQVLAAVQDAVRFAIGRLRHTTQSRTTGPSAGDFAVAASGGAGSESISVRWPVAVATVLALSAVTALTLYATSGQGSKPQLPNQGGESGTELYSGNVNIINGADLSYRGATGNDILFFYYGSLGYLTAGSDVSLAILPPPTAALNASYKACEDNHNRIGQIQVDSLQMGSAMCAYTSNNQVVWIRFLGVTNSLDAFIETLDIKAVIWQGRRSVRSSS